MQKLFVISTALLLFACQPNQPVFQTISADDYYVSAYGYWLGAVIANFTALPTEGQFLEFPNPAHEIEFVLLDEWSTDDDTHIEWVDLHILEEYGLNPSYTQIRDEWIDHINNDIWWANRAARDLMDQGWLPPETGQSPQNPYADWAVAAQIETEIFGVLAPGMPTPARDRASYFARVTNEGVVVEAASFYAELFARAFFEPDPRRLIKQTLASTPAGNSSAKIARNVLDWQIAASDDWRTVREQIVLRYANDPSWNGSRVNFGLTLMALLYGEGRYRETVTIATLAGWDNDINATTAGGLVGVMHGYSGLPLELRSHASDIYFNEDMTNLPKYDSLSNMAARTQALAEQVILEAGGELVDGRYQIPLD